MLKGLLSSKRGLIALLLACNALLLVASRSDLPTELSRRSLQYGIEVKKGVYKYCAVGFNPRRPKNHVLTNVNHKFQASRRWLPVDDEDFCVLYNTNNGTLTMHGTVEPTTKDKAPLQVWAQFSNISPATSCYCANEVFADDLGIRRFSYTNPQYFRVQWECTIANYLKRSSPASGEKFCPKCEQDQCMVARDANTGAPKPIYDDWEFYNDVKGYLAGPGLNEFRKQAMKHFKFLPEIETCTLDITNLPLPQFYCSNLHDPKNGYGYGANGKNQQCGFAAWFNCQEDLEVLGGDMLSIHIGDFNFDIEPCKKPPYSRTHLR